MEKLELVRSQLLAGSDRPHRIVADARQGAYGARREVTIPSHGGGPCQAYPPKLHASVPEAFFLSFFLFSPDPQRSSRSN